MWKFLRIDKEDISIYNVIVNHTVKGMKNMICPRCGNNVDDSYRICNICGADMPAPGETQQNEQPKEQQTQYQQYCNQFQQPQQPFAPPPSPNYYAQQNGYQYGYNPYGYPMPDPDDKPDTALNVLSFFIPILGLVMYFVEKDKKPKKAKAALKSAIISWVVAAVFLVLYFVFIFAMAFMVGAGEVYY